MVRIKPSDADERLVRTRYRLTCVVCGQKDAVDVAHLYEDATKSKASSARLILLCPTHNQAEDRSRGKWTSDLPNSLDPSLLQAEGQAKLREGEYGLAYGKARLAAYLFERKAQYSQSVDCLTEAVSAIRPVRWGDWLAQTILEGERLCKQFRIGVAVRWLFLDRVALVLYDYSRWEESIQVLEGARSLFQKVQDDPYNPQRNYFDAANSYRRQALIKASTDQLDKGEGLSEILDRLEDEATAFLQTQHYDAFATNLDVARKIALEMANNPEKAHTYSERALSQESKIRQNWVLQEHLISEAWYFFAKKDYRRTFKFMRKAMLIYRDHPVVLEPVRGSDGPRSHAIHADLQQFAIKYEDLLDDGVPVGVPVSEVPLALDNAQLVRIVNNVIAELKS
jgi:tetratricopeptide (TPR) repeat protein